MGQGARSRRELRAVLSPWSSSDGAKRTELARVTGTATAVISGSGYQIMLCDATGARRGPRSFTVQNNAPATATPSSTPNQAAAQPLVAGREFTLPSNLVTAALEGSSENERRSRGLLQGGERFADDLCGCGEAEIPSVKLPGTQQEKPCSRGCIPCPDPAAWGSAAVLRSQELSAVQHRSR